MSHSVSTLTRRSQSTPVLTRRSAPVKRSDSLGKGLSDPLEELELTPTVSDDSSETETEPRTLPSSDTESEDISVSEEPTTEDEEVQSLADLDRLDDDLNIVKGGGLSDKTRKDARPGGLDTKGLGLTGLGMSGGATKLHATQHADNTGLADTGNGLGMVASGLGVLNTLHDMGKTRKKFKNKTWKDQSTSTNMGRVGRGLQKTTGLAGGISSTAKGAMALGGASKETLKGLGTQVVAPLSIASGGMDVLSGGWRVNKARKRKNRIQRDKARLNPQRDTKKIQAMDHLSEVQSKRQKRSGMGMVTGGMGVASGALAATGVGIPLALGLGLGAGAIKGGAMLARGGKQKLRDRKARKMQALEQKDAQGTLSKRERNKLAGHRRIKSLRDKKARGEKLSFKEKARLKLSMNESKSSDKKSQRNLDTARTILDMDEDARSRALSSLGIDNKKWARISQGSEEDQLNAIVKGLKKR